MLQLIDVKKSFVEPDGSPLPILDIPEFHVAAGEQMVLVGQSGSGKTTLLHVIAGITRPDSGRVRIDGWDITLLGEAECDRFRAERIGYVFQTFNLLPGFSALENVLLAMRFARGRPDKTRAKHLLERVGLGHRLTHKPAHQQQVLDLMRQSCREEGVALVIVTHSPEVAAQFDRVDRLEQFNRVVRNRAAEAAPA